MRKFLVVGCGGSGGRTVRLLIDQLRADLRSRGISELPDAWQFVHVDVPVDPDEGPAPLGSVLDLGGHYLSFTTPANTFQATALQVESRLSQGQRKDLSPLLGWAPRNLARANGVPVTSGAGQYRAIGRMLTLPRLDQLRQVLVAAQAKAVSPTAWGQVPSAEQGSDVIIPIVVASMAGGSGASMFLDVSRVLGQLPGISPANIGCFLYTADVFAELPDDKRANVEGNAMAAVSEIIAAISRISDDDDRNTLEALGVSAGSVGTPPFGRVLPIGRRIGGSGAFFGDGSADGVYRGIARALAGVMSSEAASQQYLDSFLANPTPVPMTSDRLGWGTSDNDLPFGSMGFASLSLGRDRYIDYSAQRLSRAAVDHLVAGHLNPTSDLPSSDQVRLLMDNQWSISLQNMGLTMPGVPVNTWFQSVAYPRTAWESAARDAMGIAHGVVANSGHARASDWLASTRANVSTVKPQVVGQLQHSAYLWAETWAGELEAAAKTEFLRATAAFGLPYGRELMTRVRHRLETVVSEMSAAGSSAGAIDPTEIDETVSGEAAALGKQSVGAGHVLATRVQSQMQHSAESRVRREAAGVGAHVLRAFAVDVLGALELAANDALRGLEVEAARTASGAGLAQLHSEVYADWPDESGRVPPRFDHAQNEVLLTTSVDFPARYQADVSATGGSAVYSDGLAKLRREIIEGSWETAGSRRNHVVVEQTGHWRAPILNRGSDGAPTPQAKPTYRLYCSVREIVDRSRDRLAEQGGVFATFADQSIAQYLNDMNIAQVDRTKRQEDFVSKFLQALALARPVVGVDEQMVQFLHNGRQLSYVYTFSEIPFEENDMVASGVSAKLTGDPSLESSTGSNFRRALTGAGSTVGKISIFGSYEKVSPLCFSSLLEPIAHRWASASVSTQSNLWLWKRARPLHAALAMSRAEAVRVIAGWYLGRLVGLVRQDAQGHAEVMSEQGWLHFGAPLLSEEVGVRNPVDVLPSILMSHAWALVRCSGDPHLTALAPYEAVRRLADASASNQLAPQVAALSGTALLADALSGRNLMLAGVPVTGDGLSQVLNPSRAPADLSVVAVDQANIDNRHEAVISWIGTLREYFTSKRYVERAPDGRYRAVVVSVEALRAAPLIAEIGPLVMEALDLLERIAEAAVAQTRTSTAINGENDGIDFI